MEIGTNALPVRMSQDIALEIDNGRGNPHGVAEVFQDEGQLFKIKQVRQGNIPNFKKGRFLLGITWVIYLGAAQSRLLHILSPIMPPSSCFRGPYGDVFHPIEQPSSASPDRHRPAGSRQTVRGHP